MAWIDDEAWWESDETGLRAGRTLYWLATIIAVVIVVFALADFFISWAQGAPIVRVFAFITAAAVWLIGRVCRALLP
jgi:multisubunit Na+/H+ antiporter MnhG subunit